MSPGFQGVGGTVPRRGVARVAATLAAILPCLAAGGLSASPVGDGITYRHHVVPQHPWSIHILQVDRRRGDLVLRTVLGGGQVLGLRPLSEQVKALPAEAGSPLAALNGDFYATEHQRDSRYAFPGDPRGLHIMGGELISAAGDQASFWIDGEGTPQATNVTSRLAAVWPNGTRLPVGLNELRRGNAAALYTARMAATQRGRDGRECVLEAAGDGPWLPLQPGGRYHARIREIRPASGTPIDPNTLVLALPGEAPAGTAGPRPAPGQTLHIDAGSHPSLHGASEAIGGGEVLVRHGRKVPLKPPASTSYKHRSVLERHPRSALGANRDAWFLVQVDGRQPLLSRGMTLDELADYLLQLGCDLAMSLDGGASSTFWLDGRVRNSPCNRQERAVANGIVVLRKPASATPSSLPPKGAPSAQK